MKVLSGHIDDILVKKAAHASFDEKLSVTGLLLSRLNKAFGKVKEEEEKLVSIFDILKRGERASYGSAEGAAVGLSGGCKEPLPVRLIGKEESRAFVQGGPPS
ncbi:MAG: hypothetical protein ACLURP_01245 [Ruminococcus sp.]